MDHSENLSHRDHTIDIPRNDVTSPSTSQQDNGNLDESRHSRVLSNEIPPVRESSSYATASSSGNTSDDARRDQVHRQHNPLTSALWISIDLFVNISHIIAAIVVLLVSRNEHPHAPLFEWLVVYTIGCVATLPHLYWRYLHRNRRSTEPEPTSQHSIQRNISDPNSDVASSFHTSNSMDIPNSTGASGSNTTVASPSANAFVACFKLVLDCFFAVWFVVGNVWIFGRSSSAHDAPNLYRICVVFLVFGFVGYLMPFVLCTMICCCLPCLISILGFHEDMETNRGAATEAINALVAYKFKSRKVRDEDVGGGVLAAGTDKERAISAEDAVCCICLSKFSNDEDLRELPCAHVFHMECVDKWLQINALCPLCKAEIGGSKSVPKTDQSQDDDPPDEDRVRDDVESQR